MKRGARLESNGERLFPPVAHVSRRLNGAVVMTQRFARLLGEHLAGFGERNRAFRPLHQPRSYKSLEALDLTRQSRLRDSNLLRRSAKVKFLGESRKIPKLIQGRIMSHGISFYNNLDGTVRQP